MKKATKFQKVMSRDCSVAMLKIWQDMFLDAGKLTVRSWPKNFFIFRNSITESWRPTEIFFNKLPKDLEKWLGKNKKNEKIALKVLNDYFKYAPKLKQYKIKAKNTNQVFKEIEWVIQMNHKASTGLALGYWMWHWQEELRIVRYPELIVKLGNKLRLQDSLFDDSSEVIYQLLQTLARLIYIPNNHLKLLNFQELKKLVKTGKLAGLSKIIKQRQAGYFFYDSKVYPLEKIRHFLKKNQLVLMQENVPRQKDVIKGQIANSGKVKGKVRIVLNREQAKNFIKGEILVAAMTTPWYLPIMKQAAAFVTDEGGMMSHAAIIARELNKPCVVGTKFATKVLHDGDLVEVDAERGIVKKL